MALAERSLICDCWAPSGRFGLADDACRIKDDFSTRPRLLAKIQIKQFRILSIIAANNRSSLLGNGPNGGWRSLDRWPESCGCRRNGCGAFCWLRFPFDPEWKISYNRSEPIGKTNKLPKSPLNMLVVWAANPLSSLLTLDRKSLPPDKPSRWLLTLSLRTRFPDLLATCCDCSAICCCCCCCCCSNGDSVRVTELREDPSDPSDPNERNPAGRPLEESRELPSACWK